MQGVEVGHCNAAINAVLTANYTLLDSSVEEMIQPTTAYGKPDTLGLDARPKIDIVEMMRNHDDNCIVITEEIGAKRKFVLSHNHDPRTYRTVYICDPLDRTIYMQRYLGSIEDRTAKIREIIGQPDAIANWEKIAGEPASITGAFCALSCVRHLLPIFSVMMNYITQELFVSCSAGNYMLKLPSNRSPITLDVVKRDGARVFFPSISVQSGDEVRRFVTFVGKAGYMENLLDSKLFTESQVPKLLHYREPGGPSRILYLSGIQSETAPIGLILANGEKIGEWIHWLPWIRFAKMPDDQGEHALSVFEFHRTDQSRLKDGVLMSTPPYYSIFRRADEGAGQERMVIDIAKFMDYDNPSKIRSSLIVCPAGNTWARGLVQQCGHRSIQF